MVFVTSIISPVPSTFPDVPINSSQAPRKGKVWLRPAADRSLTMCTARFLVASGLRNGTVPIAPCHLESQHESFHIRRFYEREGKSPMARE